MSSQNSNRSRRFQLDESIEIDAEVSAAFAAWTRIEDFPTFMRCIRRTKRVGEHTVLWDVDIGGRQVVWEARIVECVPGKRIRWESHFGAKNRGEVRFECGPDSRTRLHVEIEFEPRGLLENIGARLGIPGLHVRQALAHFRRHVEDAHPPRRDESRSKARRDADDARAALDPEHGRVESTESRVQEAQPWVRDRLNAGASGVS